MNRPTRSRARSALAMLAALLALPVSAFEPDWGVDTWQVPGQAKASGCNDLDEFEIQVNPDYDAITTRQPFESNAFGTCTSCHSGSATPAGGVSMVSPQIFATSGTGAINVASSQSTSVIRIVPGNPLASLVFQKVNCDSPDVGNRMPPGTNQMNPLPLVKQALIFDWIRSGARQQNDTIFGAGFDSQR